MLEPLISAPSVPAHAVWPDALDVWGPSGEWQIDPDNLWPRDPDACTAGNYNNDVFPAFGTFQPQAFICDEPLLPLPPDFDELMRSFEQEVLQSQPTTSGPSTSTHQQDVSSGSSALQNIMPKAPALPVTPMIPGATNAPGPLDAARKTIDHQVSVGKGATRLPTSRGPILDARVRKEISDTRQRNACIRCRMQKLKASAP